MAVFSECEPAVRTAIAVTNSLAAKNSLVPEFRRLRFRMGVDKGPVVIDGDGNCPFQHLMSALDACARARLTDVAFRPPEAKS